MESTLETLAAGVEAGIQLAVVERIDDAGTPWVRLPRRKAVAARWIAGVTLEQLRAAQSARSPVVAAMVGKTAAVVLGVIAPAPAPAEARVDGKKVLIVGEEEVTLKCGKASITLTAAGKVLIKGEYVLSRSSGVNRIKGGAVQIN